MATRRRSLCDAAAARQRGRGPNGARPASLALLLALFAGCGGDSADAGPPPGGAGGAGGAPSAADGPAADAPQPVDPATAGTISGVVAFEGPVPSPAQIHMVGEAFCLQHHPGGTVDDSALLAAGGRLQNAFVWISEGLDGYVFDAPSGSVHMDQSGCLYSPRVVGLQVGQTLEIGNSDPVMHNVHVKPVKGREVNRGMPTGSAPMHLDRLNRAEIMIPVVCDVHVWMKAWIGVVEHPHFAVTGADGAFRFEGVPPGDYVVEAWHEVLGRQRVNVTLAPNGSVAVDGLRFRTP